MFASNRPQRTRPDASQPAEPKPIAAIMSDVLTRYGINNACVDRPRQTAKRTPMSARRVPRSAVA